MVKYYKDNPPNARLALDRYDFNKHITGTDFRQNATTIDLFPTLVIGGDTQTNVQSALEKLNSIITAPPLPDATTLVKGIVQLAGDIGGSAVNVVVTGLQAYPVSSIPPTNGQALVYNGGTVQWEPQAFANFTAGGDLTGTNASQQVISLTGSSGAVNVTANYILFDQSLNPIGLGQNLKTSAGDCGAFIIVGQSTSTINYNGGPVIIAGGLHSTGGLSPGVAIGSNPSALLIHATEVSTNHHVLSLAGQTDNTQMPANTGNKVIYINDASVFPTSGSPVAGAILYSRSGSLKTKRASGKHFVIGEFLDNPFTWSDNEDLSLTNNYVVSRRARATTVAAGPTQVIDSTLVNLSSAEATCKADVIVTGKQVGTNEALTVNIAFSAVTSGGSTFAVGSGTPTVSDLRTTAGAAAWTAPTIILSGNSIRVITGTAAAGANIEWFTNVQYNYSTD